MINALHQLREVARSEYVTEDDMRDDALQGTMHEEGWGYHVPAIVADLWPVLGEETRLAVYITIVRMRKAGVV